MIRVAVVDDHPAVRLGLHAALRPEPGLIPVGTAERTDEIASLLERARPDVVLLDYHLPPGDGLDACREIKARPDPPAVLLYTAWSDGSLTVPAIVAGADGIVSKGAAVAELYEAIRVVARGGSAMPPVSPERLEAAAGALDPDDLPILGMLVSRTQPGDIAQALRIPSSALRGRLGGMHRRLRRPAGQDASRPRST